MYRHHATPSPPVLSSFPPFLLARICEGRQTPWTGLGLSSSGPRAWAPLQRKVRGDRLKLQRCVWVLGQAEAKAQGFGCIEEIIVYPVSEFGLV